MADMFRRCALAAGLALTTGRPPATRLKSGVVFGVWGFGVDVRL